MLAYSAANRSASIRIPYALNPKTAHIEVRFPDCTANPYIAFALLIWAGLEGLQEKMPLRETIAKQNLIFRWVLIYGCLFAVIIFGVYGPGYDASSFIYGQF